LAMQQLPASPGDLERASARQPALSTAAPADNPPLPQRSNEADPAAQQHHPDP